MAVACGGEGREPAAAPPAGNGASVMAGSPAAAGAAGGSATAAGQGGAGTASPGASGSAGSAAFAGSSVATGGNGGSGNAGSMAVAMACPDGAFCDSFDAPGATALDPARWTTLMPNCSGTGAINLDDQVAHSGKQSVRVQGAAGYCNHVFFAPKTFSASEPLYARFFVRFAAPLGASHVTFAAFRDGSEGKDLRMGGQSEILMWNRESDDATLPELSPAGIALSIKPEAAVWLCVELVIDAQGRALRTWVGGEAVAGLVVEGDPTPDIDAQWLRKPDWQPKIEDLKLGWESYGDASNTLWFDDVAFGPTRLGCAP
jgi:hypothetical protein